MKPTYQVVQDALARAYNGKEPMVNVLANALWYDRAGVMLLVDETLMENPGMDLQDVLLVVRKELNLPLMRTVFTPSPDAK